MDIKKLCEFECHAKDVWPLEEKDFSPWVAKHLEDISQLTSTALVLDELERRIGRYEADIVARDELTDNSYVVIENKFGWSDHDHIGKCLTYMADLDASVAIWISEKFTEEHLAVIRMLNEEMLEDRKFYAICVKTYKINGDVYYEFCLKEGPKNVAPLAIDNEKSDFWTTVWSLLPQPLKMKFRPSTRNYVNLSKIIIGINFGVNFTRDNMSNVFLFNYGNESRKEFEEKLKDCPIKLALSHGSKNPNVNKWIVGHKDKDANWIAETLKTLYEFLKEKSTETD